MSEEEPDPVAQLYGRISSVVRTDNLNVTTNEKEQRTVATYRFSGQYSNKIYAINIKLTPLPSGLVLYNVTITITTISDSRKKVSVENGTIKSYSKDKVLAYLENLLLGQ